jgi:hypothetical protein
VDTVGSEESAVVGSCEHGDEASDYIKVEIFLSRRSCTKELLWKEQRLKTLS